MTDPNTGGYKSPNENSHKLRFDGTLTFGHVMTLVSFFMAGIGFYASTQNKFTQNDMRLSLIEKTQAQMASSIDKAAEAQILSVRNQDKIALTLEYLAKAQQGQHSPP